MFDYVRVLSKESAFVGRIDSTGKRHNLYSVSIDRTYYGKEWATSHGMQYVQTLRSIGGVTAEEYEYWCSPDMRLACLFPIEKKRVRVLCRDI